jgi:hypothetical protein
MTLDVWLKGWLKSVKSKLSGSSTRNYEASVVKILIPEIGDAELGQLSRSS